MNRDEAMDKIRKCLALSASPNENEAKAALLMARKLMAMYKVAEADIMDVSGEDVEQRFTSITYSPRKSMWTEHMASIICERYCCKAINTSVRGKHTRTIGFVGHPSDLDVCVQAFEYAVFAVKRRIAEDMMRYVVAESYGFGFCDGLDIVYRRQDEENQEYGLVLAVPQDVLDVCDVMGPESNPVGKAFTVEGVAFLEGRKDGINHLTPRLEGSE